MGLRLCSGLILDVTGSQSLSSVIFCMLSHSIPPPQPHAATSDCPSVPGFQDPESAPVHQAPPTSTGLIPSFPGGSARLSEGGGKHKHPTC